ncbi:MAG: ferredoxin--NADP reductase [Burkholderiales bacterium]
MAAYDTEFLAREEVAEGTMAFDFAKPAGFEFTAGQSMNVTLLDAPETDSKGNSRTFSIVSAPAEDSLTVATRMRDTAFKRVLKTMPAGGKLRLRGPAGQFVLDGNGSKPAVFLAGGIGITPFVSMLRQAAASGLRRKLYLFYSNRRPEDAAFLAELQAMQDRNPDYRFVGTMTDMEKSRQPWNGERGFISKNMMARCVDDLSAPVYYIAGPPAMVEGMQSMLAGADVKAAQIRTDEFFGY